MRPGKTRHKMGHTIWSDANTYRCTVCGAAKGLTLDALLCHLKAEHSLTSSLFKKVYGNLVRDCYEGIEKFHDCMVCGAKVLHCRMDHPKSRQKVSQDAAENNTTIVT